MMRTWLAVLAIVVFPYVCLAGQASQPEPAATRPAQLKAFLDCQSGCFADFLRAEVTFVDYVRDRSEADVHVLVTSVETGSGGSEYTLAFIGLKAFTGTDRSLRAVSGRADVEDAIRRQLANALRVGLLNYVAAGSVPPNLSVSVRQEAADRRAAPTTDKWNHWVFSIRGSASAAGEESSRQTSLGGELSADRITPEWKITFGSEFDQETEEFDLDEDDPVKVRRSERDFNWLAVKALGEHWSIGAAGDVESSTFENIKLAVSAAPAIEFNVFPYSAYTRRQLRALYSIGAQRQEYRELTLFQKLKETLPAHELSLTYEQRERWGTLEGRVEWSQYLHDLTKSRFEVQGDMSVRVTKGLTIGAELNASRIRDQLSLPARGASPEEILLRLRRLQSGYEYEVGMSLTYSFGSIFSSIVNPRFGQ
jgi:hypothetical protein